MDPKWATAANPAFRGAGVRTDNPYSIEHVKYLPAHVLCAVQRTDIKYSQHPAQKQKRQIPTDVVLRASQAPAA